MFRARHLTPLLIALFLALPASATSLYRWVDDDGNVHYTDVMPPSRVTKGHTEMSQHGVRIRAIPPAKTPEEFQKEQELAWLRSQQERLIEQQQAADRVLLRTFRSEDDMQMARDGKLAAIDVMVQVTRNNIRRQEEWLTGLRAEAADLERSGKSIPQHLRDSIAKTERSIRDAFQAIETREQQKEAIHAEFNRDLKRFRQLSELEEAQASAGPRSSTLRPVLYSIIVCGAPSECDRLWSRATDYFRERSSTNLQSSGSNILMTAPSADETTISLILSRIPDPDSDAESLFLDLQCYASTRGDTSCNSADAQEIVEGFRAAVRREGQG